MAIGYLLATTISIAFGTFSPPFESQDAGKNLGQLARYEGDWIINGDRRSIRVVSRIDAKMIQTFESEYRDNFGCPYVRFLSMRMTFDPETSEYRSQVKWSGKTVEEHLRSPWLPHVLVGKWNADTKTMTWANKKIADHQFKRLEITTHFPDANNQTTTIIETADGRKIRELFSTTFARLH